MKEASLYNFNCSQILQLYTRCYMFTFCRFLYHSALYQLDTPPTHKPNHPHPQGKEKQIRIIRLVCPNKCGSWETSNVKFSRLFTR